MLFVTSVFNVAVSFDISVISYCSETLSLKYSANSFNVGFTPSLSAIHSNTFNLISSSACV